MIFLVLRSPRPLIEVTSVLTLRIGALVYDPCIGDCGLLQYVPTYQLVRNNNEILNLDSDTVDTLEEASKECGYTAVGMILVSGPECTDGRITSYKR